MKAYLLYEQADVDWAATPDPQLDALVTDLGLETVFATMAAGERVLHTVARHTILTGVSDPPAIRYRQDVLADCLARPQEVRELYALAVDGISTQGRVFLAFGAHGSAETILHRAVAVLELLLDTLRGLRAFADRHAERFESPGFKRFFAMVSEELTDEYLDSLAAHLKALAHPRSVLMSARLGVANKGAGYLLRRPTTLPRGMRARVAAAIAREPGLAFQIADRDEAGARALSQLRDRGLNSAANAAAQSADHVLSFFAMLRAELGFYVGCLNLHEALASRGVATTIPEPAAPGQAKLRFTDLRDAGLTLRAEGPVVGNDLDADGKTLIIITGANQGGKSTFLRSVGLAQLMMQAGMFVTAERFRASACTGVATHFLREEDATMTAGKLDEELARLSRLVDRLRPDALVLFNESFAATNEREGSEIARQIINALRGARIRVAFVTHMFDLAHGYYAEQDAEASFLRAERLTDQRRTFRLIEDAPEPSSHGEDIYERVFAVARR